MNLVRAKRLGQFPGEGIASDITLGPQDTIDSFPMYYDPGLLIAEQGAPAPAPAATVPQPPATDYLAFGPISPSTAATLNYPTVPATAQIPAPGSISPAPHVTIPISTASGFMASSFAGIPMPILLGVGAIGLLALSSAGGSRRRR